MTRKVELDKATAAELKALRKMKRDYERLKLEHDILEPPPEVAKIWNADWVGVPGCG